MFSLETFCLDISCLEAGFHSHVFLLASFSPAWRLFLLTFSSFANKIRPVCYKGCTKYFLYCKVCTKYFPVLLRTTKLSHSSSEYYFVLQELHKVLPALLCTTKVAQSTSQYYFALQDLHKLLSSTTLYYKGFTKIRKVLSSTTSDALSANKNTGFSCDS